MRVVGNEELDHGGLIFCGKEFEIYSEYHGKLLKSCEQESGLNQFAI